MPIGVVHCVRLCLIAKGRDWLPQHDSGRHGPKFGLLSITFVTEVCRSLDASSGTAKSDRPDWKWMGKWGKSAGFGRNSAVRMACATSVSPRDMHLNLKTELSESTFSTLRMDEVLSLWIIHVPKLSILSRRKWILITHIMHGIRAEMLIECDK